MELTNEQVFKLLVAMHEAVAAKPADHKQIEKALAIVHKALGLDAAPVEAPPAQ